MAAITCLWKDGDYLFSPLSMLQAVMTKIRQDKVTVMLITCLSPTNITYSIMMDMCKKGPVLLPPAHTVLVNPNKELPPEWKLPRLTALVINGKI